MRSRLFVTIAGILALVLAQPSCGQAKDAADLFPAHTLAYLEVRQPDRLSREVATLVKGSALENLPATLAKFRANQADTGPMWHVNEVAMFGMFLSPEMISEAGRLGGAAVALTGIDKENGPEITGVIFSGQSNLPTFVLRVFLVEDSNIHEVATCEGVTLYRSREHIFRGVGAGGGPAPAAKETGPTLALLPDGLIIGSSTEGVKDVIRRMKDKSADPSLAGTAAFKEAATARDRPGLFGYANVDGLNTLLEDALKTAPKASTRWMVMLKALVNPTAIRSLVAGVTLENGTAELRVHLGLDGKQSSPLLDVLSDRKVDPILLHAMPANVFGAATTGLADGEQRLEKLLALLDTLATQEGAPDDQLPSKQLADLEGQIKLRIGKDVLTRVTGVAVGYAPRAMLPLLSVGAKDAEAAKFLEEQAVPKLAALLNKGHEAEPTSETLQGQTVRSLPLPGIGKLYYASRGTTLVVADDARSVAVALAASEKRTGLLAEGRVAAAIKDCGDATLLGVWSAGDTLAEWLRSQMGNDTPAAGPKPKNKAAQKPEDVSPDKAEDNRLLQNLTKLAEAVPPAVIVVVRKPETATLEIRLPMPRGTTAKAIDLLVEASLHHAVRAERNQRATVAPAAVPVDTPPMN
jgi:hypothetical protein